MDQLTLEELLNCEACARCKAIFPPEALYEHTEFVNTYDGSWAAETKEYCNPCYQVKRGLSKE